MHGGRAYALCVVISFCSAESFLVLSPPSLSTETLLNNLQKYSPYLKENATELCYKYQLVNAV
jgi:hypothetical protein